MKLLRTLLLGGEREENPSCSSYLWTLPQDAVTEILSFLDYKELCRTDVTCKRLRLAGVETWKRWEATLSLSGKCPSASSSSNGKQGFIKFSKASSKAKQIQALLSHKHGGFAECFGTCRRCEALRALHRNSESILHDHWRDYDFFCRLEESCWPGELYGDLTLCLYEGFLPYQPTIVTDSGETKMLWRTEKVLSNLATEWDQMTRTLDFHSRRFVFGNLVFLPELADALLSYLKVTILAVPKVMSAGNNNLHDDYDEGIQLVAYGRHYDGNRTSNDTTYSRFHFKEEQGVLGNPGLIGCHSLYLTFKNCSGDWKDTKWLGIGLAEREAETQDPP